MALQELAHDGWKMNSIDSPAQPLFPCLAEAQAGFLCLLGSGTSGPECKSKTQDSFWLQDLQEDTAWHRSAQVPAQELWLLLAGEQKSKNIQGSTSPQ